MINQIQILPHESSQEIDNLRAELVAEFTHASYLETNLLEIFIKSSLQFHRADSAADQLELELHLTGLPMHYWDQRTFRQIHFVQRHKQAAHRHFNRSLQMLQSIRKSKPAVPKPSTAVDPAPSETETSSGAMTFRQTVWTSYVDGVLTTTTSRDAAEWLRRRPTLDAIDFIRYFHFPNADIPEPYRYLLINPDDDSIEQNPKPYIAAYYDPEEFYRLCALEVETNSPHLLGGQPFDITYT